MGQHAKLSPSKSNQWLNCTPSVALEALEPQEQSSEFAQEGTEAHELAEIILAWELNQVSYTEHETRMNHFMTNSKYYNEEFREYVDVYVKNILTLINEEYKGHEVKVILEARVNMTHIIPKGFGTSDVVLLIPALKLLHIVDLKFGRGVAVSAIENTQLMLYAVGALHTYQLHGPFETVKMTIDQPRLYDISTYELPVKELNHWALDYVKPRAEMAIEGLGLLSAGDHCKWCRRRHKCEELGQHQLAIAHAEFDNIVVRNNVLDPREMSPEMLSRILEVGPKFVDWFKDISAYATAAMINDGLKIPNYKVVRGISRRSITAPDLIVKTLADKGFAEEKYLEPKKLLGITALEKNIGKKLFNELCGDYVIKPEGKLTIAVESDKREAITSHKLIGQEFDN